MKHAWNLRVTALDAHMHTEHTSLSYPCISIKPADKAAEYLVSSYKPLLLLIVNKEKQTKTFSREVMRTGRNWTAVGTRSQMTSRCNGSANHSKPAPSLSLSFFFVCLSPPSSFLSQSILCNCLKVCTQFPLEGADRVTRSDCQR